MKAIEKKSNVKLNDNNPSLKSLKSNVILLIDFISLLMIYDSIFILFFQYSLFLFKARLFLS